MAIWISRNNDTGQSLISRDSFPRRKFQNRTPRSCRPGPILSPTTISFELHAKMAEEIDLEKCNFRNFRSSVTLTFDRVEVILLHISCRGLPTQQITLKSEKKNVCGRTDRYTYGWTDIPEFQSIRSSLGDDLKILQLHSHVYPSYSCRVFTGTNRLKLNCPRNHSGCWTACLLLPHDCCNYTWTTHK